MKNIFALLLVPSLLLACGSPPSNSSAQSKSSDAKQSSKDSEPQLASQDASGGTNSNVVMGDDEEATTPPQPVTATYLTCVKPKIENFALNIDCLVKNDAGVRVDPASLGKRVVYGVDSKEKDDDVLVSMLKPESTEEYDIRYAVYAKNVDNIEKVVDSSTFFATVYDEDNKVVENAVKPFLGIDLDFPSKEELLAMVVDKFDDIKGLLGL